MLQKLKKRKLEPKLNFSVLQEQHEKDAFKNLIVETLGHPDNCCILLKRLLHSKTNTLQQQQSVLLLSISAPKGVHSINYLQEYDNNEQDANDNFQQLQQSLKAVGKKVIPPKPRKKHRP